MVNILNVIKGYVWGLLCNLGWSPLQSDKEKKEDRQACEKLGPSPNPQRSHPPQQKIKGKIAHCDRNYNKQQHYEELVHSSPPFLKKTAFTFFVKILSSHALSLFFFFLIL